jgi:glucokinase
MDVGGSHVTAAAISDDHILDRVEAPLDPHGTADEILGAIVDAGLALGPHSAWTLAMPGPFDYERGVGSFAGAAKFAALAGLDLRGIVGERLGATRIAFLDDADAYGLGEWAAGAARGHDRAVCITLGTGLGASFLREGLAVGDGPGIPAGGNLYPFEYQGRPVEDTVSTRALLAAYGENEVTVRELFERARAGAASPGRVIDETFEHLGRFLAPFVVDFAPTIVVVGGSISRSWDLIEAPLRRGLGPVDVALARSELLDDAPLLGAALVASRG